jgi:hypothetical protein
LDLDHHLLALRRQIVKMLNIPAVFHERYMVLPQAGHTV